MALSLLIAQPTGTTASYWKVSKMHIDTIAQNITVEVGGYIDQPTYASGASPIATLMEIMGPTQFAAIVSSSNIIAEFYTLLSAMPDFAGSTIVS